MLVLLLQLLYIAFAGSDISFKDWMGDHEVFQETEPEFVEDIYEAEVERICKRAREMDKDCEYQEAEFRLRELVEKDSRTAAFRLAQMIQRNPDYAIKSYIQLLRFAAESGHAEAEFWYAKAYLEGLGVSRNALIAASRFRTAWERGFERGKTRLAELYWGGDGVRQNLPFAVKLFEEAAEKGEVDAQYALGEIYLEQALDAQKGFIMEKDSLSDCLRQKTDRPMQVAFEYFTKAAKKDHGLALIRQGELLFLGLHGDDPDYPAALQAWSRCAILGMEEAQSIMHFFQSKVDVWPASLYKHPSLGSIWPSEVPREQWQYLIGMALAKDRRNFKDIRRSLVYFRLSAKAGFLLADTAAKNAAKHLRIQGWEGKEVGRFSDLKAAHE